MKTNKECCRKPIQGVLLSLSLPLFVKPTSSEELKVIDFYYMKEKVDAAFNGKAQPNHELLAESLLQELTLLNESDFEYLLITTGYIPDFYRNDSSEETLFTKFIETIVCAWALRLGAQASLVKTKGSREDVTIIITDKVVVCDAKSFRLGRSQAAPNAKDFLKLEDIRKWMDLHPNSIGGLVTFPSKHEWNRDSDVYQYCSTKSAPTVMLPYQALAYIFHYRNLFTQADLLALWDYETLFPNKLVKKMPGGNKNAYWKVMEGAIANLTRQSLGTYRSYMENANTIIDQAIEKHLKVMEQAVNATEREVNERVNKLSETQLKEALIKYMVANETQAYRSLISNIRKFRL